MTKLWAICRNTLIETIRQPIYGWLVMGFILLLWLTLAVPKITLEMDWESSDEKMLQILGLSTLLIGGLLLAVFSATGALSREIDDGTALTVMVKPLGRTTFVTGKFLGLAAAMTLAYAILTLVFLLTVRHGTISSATEVVDWPVVVLSIIALAGSTLFAAVGNYAFRWSFWSTWVLAVAATLAVVVLVICFVGKTWTIVPFGYDIDVEAHYTITKVPAISGQLLLGVALIFMAVLILTAVAIAASTRLGTTLTLTTVLAAFAIGSMHPYLFGHLAQSYPGLHYVGWFVPDLTFFFPLDALTKGDAIPGSYVLLGGGYCLLFVLGALAVGAGLFQTRQLESLSGSKSMPPLVGLIAGLGRIGSLLAMLIAAVLAMTQPFWNFRGALIVLAVLAGGAGGLLYWTHFAHGRRWTWWLGLFVAAGGTLAIAVLWTLWAFQTDAMEGRPELELALGLLGAGLGAAVLLLPGTRRHFRS